MKKILLSGTIAILFLLLVMPAVGCAQRDVKIVTVGENSSKGYLGVYIDELTNKIIKKKNIPVEDGAYISGVADNSPAEEAGIEDGDVIVKFGDRTIYDGDDLRNAIKRTKPKTEVKVELYRHADKKTVTVKVGKTKSSALSTYNLGHAIDIPNLPNLPKFPKTFNSHISVISERVDIDGLRVQELTKQLGDYFGISNDDGVLVTEVDKESDYAKAGLTAGDVITKIENRTIDDINELTKCLDKYEGKDVTIDVLRDHKKVTIKMKLAESEDDEWEE
jgi:serine protease Do